MKKIILFAFLFICLQANSQETPKHKGSYLCSQKHLNSKFSVEKSLNSPNHSFDVLHYNVNVDLYHCYATPYPHSFTGNVTISIKADSSINQLVLNAMSSDIVVDSVRLSGTSFSHTGNLLSINLNSTYNTGDVFEVKIYYKHNDVSNGGFYCKNGFAFTDCEPEGARYWFPCWDKPSDKATFELSAKTPANVKLGSNGSLIDSVVVGDTIYYHWLSRDPLSTYLAVITSKANYKLDIVYWKNPSNPNDSTPMRFYYNDGENPLPMEQIISPMTSFYSEKFGNHPFEKNGFAALNNDFQWGGMENQTLTSICPNCWYESLIAHEFAHQWFGDMITCGTWADIFLNEGFATYIEALWLEHAYHYQNYKSDIISDANYYLNNNPGVPIYNPQWAIQTPNINNLFNYATTYCKGACVLHMFRYVVGDSLFFKALKGYATDTVDFKYNNSMITDFKVKVNQETGMNLDWFFEQWLSFKNHPVYANQYQIINNNDGTYGVDFQTQQTQAGTTFFKMPLELKVHFIDNTDTLLTVMNDVNNQLFSFNFSKLPTTLIFDPDTEIVLKQGTTQVSVENILASDFKLGQNIPNPVSSTTSIEYELPYSSDVFFNVYDICGKEILHHEFKSIAKGKHTIMLDKSQLQQGVYYYKMQTKDFQAMRKMLIAN